MNADLAKKLIRLRFQVGSFLFPRWTAEKAFVVFTSPQRTPRPESEKAWTDAAEKGSLKNGIATFSWGPRQGPLVFLIHGWSGRGTQLGAFAAPLAQKGMRVVAMDGPSHGDSADGEANAGAYAQFIIDAEKELGRCDAVIGHSFGAGCAVLAIARGFQAKKLVLIASPSRYTRVVANFAQRIGLGKRARIELDHIITSRAGISPENLNISLLGQNLKIKSLIVHDKDDKEVPYASGLEIHHTWPHSQLLTTQGLGHRRVLKDPLVVQTVADFILEPSETLT